MENNLCKQIESIVNEIKNKYSIDIYHEKNSSSKNDKCSVYHDEKNYTIIQFSIKDLRKLVAIKNYCQSIINMCNIKIDHINIRKCDNTNYIYFNVKMN